MVEKDVSLIASSVGLVPREARRHCSALPQRLSQRLSLPGTVELVRVGQQPAAFCPSVGDWRRWRQQAPEVRGPVEGTAGEYVRTMAAESPTDWGAPRGQPAPSGDPRTAGPRPDLPWPSDGPWREEPPWPNGPAAPAVAEAATGASTPAYGPGEPPASGPVRRPTNPVPVSVPVRAAWCAVPGLVVGYALAIVGATVGDIISGSATGPLATLLSEMGLWTGMLGTAIFVSRRFGTASLRRDFGLAIKAPDLLWGLAAVAAALVVSELVVFSFAGTKFAGTNDQIITQQKGHDVGFVILTLIVELGAPFFEELFFRGFLGTALQARFGANGAVWLQAVFFGLAHAGESKTAAGNVTVVLALFLVGVVLGYTARLTGRLGAGMVAHCLFNLVAVVSVL